ncbi:hypothetical protein GP486_005287 [Trichoglossum hirsutum]|uniref:NEDD8-activating enzyme E1 regulatory subunit n=1 Tax=Trichoglossum hirsutum TaxID=265104 RepID=A0A9P8RMI3_9PEZI|nr:hypothetical protein GP486_005287 [Trichoglossum hirsutum]
MDDSLEDSPSPPQEPSSKEKKYDRQLRMWGSTGQVALESARVLLIQAGPNAVGIETLKNLVLPGIERYTIVDPSVVTEEDTGVNFFVDGESIGQLKAKVCCQMLQELNPDVDGEYLTEPIESLLRNPSFLLGYSLILVAAPIFSPTLKTIAAYAWEHELPLFYIHSLGFYSYFTVSLPPCFPVIETHPDQSVAAELRLTNPWPELAALAKEVTAGLEEMNDHDHGHVPYVLLLLHYLELWKQDNEGRVPATYREKLEFRKLVEAGARTENAEGGEENYEEAAAAVLKSLNPATLTWSIREIFQATECVELTTDSPIFWFVAAAVKDFERKHHVLPLHGSVPDMKAKTADYIRLQKVYKAKARQDAAEVLANMRVIKGELGCTSEEIYERVVDDFCREAAFVRFFRGQRLPVACGGEDGEFELAGEAVEHEPTSGEGQALEDPESLMPLYITLLAYDVFINSRSRNAPPHSPDSGPTTLLNHAPGHASSTVHTDEQELSRIAHSILFRCTRSGGGDLHNISALTGGMVAQEAIKVITRQYVPADNTVVFDGIRSKVWVFRRTADMFSRP